jgi:uncharacterized repeat protein (TIGR01451 family)
MAPGGSDRPDRWACGLRRRWSVALIAPLFVALLLALPASDAFAGGHPGSLAVRVLGLPPHAAANVLVRGPRFSKVLKGSRTLTHLRPGRYTLTVRQVRLAGGHRVKANSLALPAGRATTAKVAAGRRAKATALYGTIIRPNVHRLTSLVAVRGSSSNPTSLVLRPGGRITVGTILTAAPSAKLPAGLFHKVVSIRKSGHRVVIALKPAHLLEAFAQVAFDSTVNFAPGRNTGATHAAGFDPLVASLGIGNFRCALPLADSYLTEQQNFSVGAEVQFHVPTFFGIPDGLPEGKIALTAKASASLEALIRKNTGCSAQVRLARLPGEIPVGPVVVPVFLEVTLFGSATIGADLHAQASAGLSLTAGVEFHGTDIRNISGAHASAGASASGAGKLAAGVGFRFAVGVADIADVHLDVKPQLAFEAALDGSCSLNLGAPFQVGVSLGPFQLNQPLGGPSANLYRCPKPQAPPHLAITESAPFGAFPNQSFGYSIKVTNTGASTAHGVSVVDTVPGEGAFVSSTPAGSPAPGPGGTETIPIGDLTAGQTTTVTVQWRAPANAATLVNSAVVQASNAGQAGPASASVPVGTTGSCNPCGAASGGTGLRNREHGSIAISGIPAGATVGRAVLIWGILYNGEVPRNSIGFDGHQVAADVTSSVSGNLCWGDSATVGYAADVTPYVTGNGDFQITEAVNGSVHVDEDPEGPLPYTDGASLLVFYNGGGADNQVLSDFAYNTNTDPTTGSAITRSFSGVNSVGGPATLTLAGPDGQNNGGKTFTFTGAGQLTVENPYNGLAPQDGPRFPIGSLWDNEDFDVTSIMPPGQSTFEFTSPFTSDCIGVGATVLQVAQHP